MNTIFGYKKDKQSRTASNGTNCPWANTKLICILIHNMYLVADTEIVLKFVVAGVIIATVIADNLSHEYGRLIIIVFDFRSLLFNIVLDIQRLLFDRLLSA